MISAIWSGNIYADLQDLCVVPVSSVYQNSLRVEGKRIISWPATVRKKRNFEDTSRYGALVLILGEKDCNQAIRDAY